MSDSKDNTKVEEDLSRMEGAYGKKMISKLKKMKVLLVGLRGLGVETAKNLILMGPAAVTLYDPRKVEIADLNCNFYLEEKHVGKPRAASCYDALSELNPNTNTYVVEGELTEKLVHDHHVMVICDYFGEKDLTKWSNWCRSRKDNVAFIWGCVDGLSGSVFSDFGDNHSIFDSDGEQPKTAVILGVQNSKPGIVTIDGTSHGFHTGDAIHITEVEGMDGKEADPEKVWKLEDKLTAVNGIHIIKDGEVPMQFLIGDTEGLGEYKSGGYATQVKLEKVKKYTPFAESAAKPVFDPHFNDFSKFGAAGHGHIGRLAVARFMDQNDGALPGVHSAKDADAVAKLGAEIGKGAEYLWGADVDTKAVRNRALYAQCEIPALTALFGGVVAQEVAKWTGKYNPIDQWIHYCISEIIGDEPPKDGAPQGTRYDHQIAVFGKEWNERVRNFKTFMVGCGALGCEYLKAFALMGLGCGKEGSVTLTDDDIVELSNLSRQFLFRRKHVKKGKAESASAAAIEMNPEFKNALKAHSIRVEPKTEDTFNDKFWTGLDAVVNALDNMKARFYVDSQCVLFEKPLFESGTLGVMANTAVCLPHQTPSYSEGATAGEDQGVAMCTLRSFPHLITHCIEWAKVRFDEYFVEGPELCIRFLADREKFLSNLELDQASKGSQLKKLKFWMGLADVSKDAGVQFVVDKFLHYHRDYIKLIRHNFPEDAKDKEGRPFWRGHKRFPQAVEFDPNDELVFESLYTGACIVLNQMAHYDEPSRDEFREMLKKSNVPEWKFSGEKLDLKTDEEAKAEAEAKSDDGESKKKQTIMEKLEAEEKELEALVGWAKELPSSFKFTLRPVDFEKDDPDNHHIAFITAATNLRATNYRIKHATEQKCRMVAGKIIPAIATATASITGFVMVELCKFIAKAKYEQHRAATFHLGVNNFTIELLPDPKKKRSGLDMETYMKSVALPEGFTTWDFVDIKGSRKTTVQEFFDQLGKEHHNIEPWGLQNVSGKSVAFVNLADENYQQLLKQPLVGLYEETVGPINKDRNFIALDVNADTEDGDTAVIPKVKFYFE